MLSVDGQRAAHAALHDLAHEVAGGRWVATGGGGYAVVEVVPRTWTHLLAIVGGGPVDPKAQTPAHWREYVARVTGRTAPTRMTDDRDPRFDDWAAGYTPESWLDRSIARTRDLVFPPNGIDVS
jgi:acetoin utilization protein AcuC